ncbi:MAG: phosphate uptake regulator PhoU, partial [Oceanidesulfovibrio sp.]
YHFAKDYGVEHGDTAFDARLALGLARSFITSTRFELNPRFAKDMFLRGVYLLEKILDHRGKPWDDFVLSEDALVY